jgi:hypothetical protein
LLKAVAVKQMKMADERRGYDRSIATSSSFVELLLMTKDWVHHSFLLFYPVFSP